MAIKKYIKQPISGSAAQYADNELKKIEQSNSSFFDALEELFDMAAAIETGSFVLTTTGLNPNITVTVQYARSGSIVVLFIPNVSGTSNATTFTLTGVPAALRPLTNQGLQNNIFVDNTSSVAIGAAQVLTTGVIDFRFALTGAGWTASGTKATSAMNLVYLLN